MKRKCSLRVMGLHKFVHNARSKQAQWDASPGMDAAPTEVQTRQLDGAVAVAQKCRGSAVA